MPLTPHPLPTPPLPYHDCVRFHTRRCLPLPLIRAVCELLAFRLREEGIAVVESLAEKLKPKERDALIHCFASGKEVRARVKSH